MEIHQSVLLLLLVLVVPLFADPEANLLQSECSTVKITNVTVFQQNLNASLASVLQAVASSGFAAEEEITGSDPVYMLAQCRQDKTSSDCVECITAAQNQIRNCSNLSGGRIIYDGCFLRYENYNFYSETSADENSQLCGSQSIGPYYVYNYWAFGSNLLSNLCAATPKTSNFFAAQSEIRYNTTIYGLAWCLKSLSKEGCKNCLKIAQTTIDGCLSQSEGRAVGAGCSLRYATYPFFSDKDATDLSNVLYPVTSIDTITYWVCGGLFVILVLVVFLCAYDAHHPSPEGGEADRQQTSVT